MEIHIIDEQSNLLPSIVRLGDQNSNYLGFFAEKAFHRAAGLGHIVAATESQQLLGYLLFYCAKSRAVIQHLCVSPKHRGKGIARRLVEFLRQHTLHCTGILLHCDRSFPAYHQWLKLGFVPIGEKRGRGRAETTLTRFWLDYGHPDLITSAIEASFESRQRVVLDLNVVYDLHDLGKEPNPESKGLMADWLKDRIACFLTDEVFCEIDRHTDQTERKRRKDVARGYAKVSAPEDRVTLHLTKLSAIFPDAAEASDRRHLAITAAAGIPFFITRDDLVLNCAAAVEKECSTLPIHPTNFIMQFSEIERQYEYEPLRLSGSNIQIKRIGAGEFDLLHSVFLDHTSGEKKAAFNAHLRALMARPDLTDAWIALRGEEMLALFVTSSSNEILNVPLLRVKRSDLAGVILRNILLMVTKTAATKCYSLICITDTRLSSEQFETVREVGFQPHGAVWLRPVFSGIKEPSELSECILRLAGQLKDYESALFSFHSSVQAGLGRDASLLEIARAEASNWPCKCDNARLPCFIIPIRPRWAMHLFDSGLANQDLFGAMTLALNWEQVYYRSSRPSILQAPGRVLWYVSDDQTFEGTHAIRACSNLSEVFVGPVKQVFRRFERLGVFQWSHVKDIADRNPNGEIMGVRFGMTELFPSPISRPLVMQILSRTLGSRPPLSTAVQIPPAAFFELYLAGNQNAVT